MFIYRVVPALPMHVYGNINTIDIHPYCKNILAAPTFILLQGTPRLHAYCKYIGFVFPERQQVRISVGIMVELYTAKEFKSTLVMP